MSIISDNQLQQISDHTSNFLDWVGSNLAEIQVVAEWVEKLLDC